jgi:hypothetical protein
MSAESQGPTRRESLVTLLVTLAAAVRDASPSQIERAIQDMGERSRWLAPLGYVAGGFGLLFDGLKLLVLNWRLTLIELWPAVWIWVTFWDLKAHYLKGRELTFVTGWLAVALALVVVALTVAAYWCNAVFAFAVAGPRPPLIRPAVAQAQSNLRLILGWGIGVGIAHAVATIFVARTTVGWFTLALGAVLVVMSVTFVSVPADLIGYHYKPPLKEKITGAAAGGAMSAVLTSPGFLLNRIGLLLLGVSALRIPAIIVFSIGVALQAAATSGAKAVKLGSRWAQPAPAE